MAQHDQCDHCLSFKALTPHSAGDTWRSPLTKPEEDLRLSALSKFQPKYTKVTLCLSLFQQYRSSSIIDQLAFLFVMSNKHLNLLCCTSKLPFLPPLLRVDSPWCHPVLPRYRLRSLKEKKTLWLRAPQTGVKTSKWQGGGTKKQNKNKAGKEERRTKERGRGKVCYAPVRLQSFSPWLLHVAEAPLIITVH